MFVLVIALIWTGLTTQYELMEELHPILAHVLTAAIVAHLSGILLHTSRQKENIAMSIISGKKDGPEEAGLKGQQLIAGVLAALVVAFWFVSLFSGYDSATSRVRIPLTGQNFLLEKPGDKHDEKDKD